MLVLVAVMAMSLVFEPMEQQTVQDLSPSHSYEHCVALVASPTSLIVLS